MAEEQNNANELVRRTEELKEKSRRLLEKLRGGNK